MDALSSDLMGALREAGWFEGRRVAVDASVSPEHPAHEVLAELGGLQLVREGIVELDFQYVPEVDREIEPWAEALQTRLIGIAEAHNGHGILYMTSGGQIIGASIIHPACWFDGRTIEEALARLLPTKPWRRLGRRLG